MKKKIIKRKCIAKFPKNNRVVGLTTFKDQVIIATQNAVYVYADEKTLEKIKVLTTAV